MFLSLGLWFQARARDVACHTLSFDCANMAKHKSKFLWASPTRVARKPLFHLGRVSQLQAVGISFEHLAIQRARRAPQCGARFSLQTGHGGQPWYQRGATCTHLLIDSSPDGSISGNRAHFFDNLFVRQTEALVRQFPEFGLG